MKHFIALILLVSFGSAFAEEINSTKVASPAQEIAAPKKWQATLSTYFYDFQGTKAAKDDLYSFSDSNLSLQLLTVSYQLSPKWTLMAIGQQLDNYVETNLGGSTYHDRTKGLGDLILSAVTPITMSGSLMVLGDIGVSLPTGSINNQTAGGGHYAYNMQNGSGTYDALAGLTVLDVQPQYQLGSHLAGAFRTGVNSNNYHLGNQYKLDLWADYPTSLGITPRLVGYYKHRDSISGFDPSLGRSKYTEFYHHAQINWDVSAALKYVKAMGPVSIAAEIGKPLAQNSENYDDVVVSTDTYGSLSLSGAF